MPRPDATRRALVLGVLAALAALPPAAAAEPTPRQEIEGRLMCYCGCADLTVRVCTCGTADAIRRDISSRLDSGAAPEAVIAAYVAQHGEKILSAPTREGFNLLAWIMPFAVLGAAAATLIFAVRRWSRPAAAPAGGAAAPAPAPYSDADRALLERVRREIEESR